MNKKTINKILIIIVFILILSNSHFYNKSKELENNSDYISNFSGAVSIAANSNDYAFLIPKLNPSNLDELIRKFEKIKPEIGTDYRMQNHIIIEYENGNSLIVKTTQDQDGKFLIEDMFILDNK